MFRSKICPRNTIHSDFAIPVVNHIKNLVRSGIWNSWGWHWEPYERGTWEIQLENLVGNDWKPYQETYQQPCREPQIRNPFTNPKLATQLGGEFVVNHNRNLNRRVSRTFCWEPCLEPHQEPYRQDSKYPEPYRNSYQQLLGTISRTQSGTLSTTSSPASEFCWELETWGPKSEIDWESCWEPGGIQWKAAPACPETFTLVEDLQLSAPGEKCVGNSVGKFLGGPVENPVWEPCLGTLETVENPVGNLVGNPVGYPVWEPSLGTLLGTVFGTLWTLLGTLLATVVGNPVVGNPVGNRKESCGRVPETFTMAEDPKLPAVGEKKHYTGIGPR